MVDCLSCHILESFALMCALIKRNLYTREWGIISAVGRDYWDFFSIFMWISFYSKYYIDRYWCKSIPSKKKKKEEVLTIH